MKNIRSFFALITTALILSFAAQSILAHVTISPRESTASELETYTIRVPTERDVPTVRIEIEFPMGVSVSDFDSASGWNVESITSEDGQIKGAAWIGGSIAKGESEEFSFSSQNPGDQATLVWKVVQIHSDGSKAEWIGESGSSNPAPVVEIKSLLDEGSLADESGTGETTVTGDRATAERLSELNALVERGLISEEEYQEARRSILGI